MTNTQLAKELIQDHTIDGVCTLSKKKLGELLHFKYPAEFDTPESGRYIVRMVTDGAGEKNRKAKLKAKVEWNGFKLPEQEKNDFSKYIIYEKRIGILSDIHFPYADINALNVAVKYLLEWNPSCIILNGDIIDCYQLSFYERDPRKRSFKYELDMLKNFFEQIRQLFPNTRIVFRSGNHERRYERRILQQVPEMIDLELFTFENVIKSAQYGIEYVGNKRLIKAGHLNIAHGDEFQGGGNSPVNPARGYYLKAKTNIICGHNHRTSNHIERDLNDKIIGAWSIGCLSELNPSYMPINNWNLGFCTVEISGDEFSVNNMKIINGKVV